MQISASHPALAGHFPGHPIVPAVVLLEQVRVTLGVHRNRAVTLAALPSVKFHAPIAPGDEFQIHFVAASSARVNFEIRAGEKLCVSGTLVPGET